MSDFFDYLHQNNASFVKICTNFVHLFAYVRKK